MPTIQDELSGFDNKTTWINLGEVLRGVIRAINQVDGSHTGGDKKAKSLLMRDIFVY